MRKINPNTKSNKFFGQEEFKLDVEMAREWFEGDNNLKVILYRIDKTSTQTNNIYNEVRIDEKRYKEPIELNVYPTLNESENKAYNQSNSTIRYSEDGDFSFIVFEDHLRELGVEINYGDHIGYRVTETDVRYFEVIDDDKINFANNRTILGHRAYYKQIRCKVASNDSFRGV